MVIVSIENSPQPKAHGLVSPASLTSLVSPASLSSERPAADGVIKRLLMFLCLLGSLSAVAQQGRVTVAGDTRVTQMVEKHIELNERMKTLLGYRVQIGSFSGTNSKNSSFALRDRFAADYPDVQAYIVFDEPNFKVKVGDFRTRLEAYAFLTQIKEAYKGYIVKDNINPEPPVQQEYAPDDEASGDE